MTTQTRTGLLAGLILVGLLAVVAVIAVLTSPGATPDIEGGGKRIKLDLSEPGTGGLFGKAIAHPFWRRKVSRTEVEQLVEVGVGSQRYTLIFVDDQLRTEVVTGSLSVQDAYRDHGVRWRPDGFPRRSFCLDMRIFDTRPSPAQVLRSLVRELDRADFAQNKQPTEEKQP